jgi:hypothetical protein
MTMSHQQDVRRASPAPLPNHPNLAQDVRSDDRRASHASDKSVPFTLNLQLDWQASKIGLLSTAQLTGGKTARLPRRPRGNAHSTENHHSAQRRDHGYLGRRWTPWPSRLLRLLSALVHSSRYRRGPTTHRMIRESRGARPDCRECRRG